jgi:hypothetical protein
MQVLLHNHVIAIGEHFRISFQRTLRIPDDGRTYPLPPGLGTFPILAAEPLGHRVPPDWRGPNSFLIPMYQREALWLGFGGSGWPPVAVKVAIGTVNALSGRTDEEGLHADPQDYVVCPDQLWLDGINTGSASIRQFVAMPLGLGYTVEAAITHQEEVGGMQITVFEPKPGAIPEPPPAKDVLHTAPARFMTSGGTMGLGAGGHIAQKIYPDRHGISVWDQSHAGRIFIHIVNSLVYREITGTDPPPTPIDAKTYTERGFPWFDLYEEEQADVAAPDALANVKTIADRDRETGEPASEDSVDVDPSQVLPIRRPNDRH